MGPHPAVAAVRLAVRHSLARFTTPEQPLLVACSGGADSVALAAATAFELQRTDRAAGFITVDHGLQPGSAERAAQVAELGYDLGFDPVLSIAVEVGSTGGPEAAARSARYAALAAAASTVANGQTNGPPAAVLVGHTADDQAETVLLGLGRGSGLTSLAGMRPQAGNLLRPLLGLRRSETRAACEALGLPVWDDPHNADPRYRRVRVRREVLPLLDDVLGGGVVEALARTAAQLQEADDALRWWADRMTAHAEQAAGSQPAGNLAVSPLADCPPAVMARVLKRWAESSGVPALSAVHVHALSDLVTDWHGQGPVDLPGGYRAIRRSGTLNVVPPVTEPLDAPLAAESTDRSPTADRP